jgi:hypothetical protein
MYNFFISCNRFLNRLLIASILVFCGYCLAGCARATHAIPQGQAVKQVQSESVSQARLEYQNMIRFKAKNKAFYGQFKG